MAQQTQRLLTVEIDSIANGVLVSVSGSPHRGDPLGMRGHVGPLFYETAEAAIDAVPELVRQNLATRRELEQMCDARILGLAGVEGI